MSELNRSESERSGEGRPVSVSTPPPTASAPAEDRMSAESTIRVAPGERPPMDPARSGPKTVR